MMRRVKRARIALRQIEAGAAAARAGVPGGDDELGDLLRGIDALAARLARHEAEAARRVATLAEAEARANQREQQFRLLFEQAPIAIWEFDRRACIAAILKIAAEHGDVRTYLRRHPERLPAMLDLLKLTAANPAMHDFFQAASEAEIYRRPVHTTIAPESYVAMIDIFADGAMGVPVSNTEVIFTLPSGERRHGRVSVRRIQEGHPHADRVIVSLIDITASRQAEALLRESEARFRSLVRDMTIGVTLHGPRGEFLLCNPAAAQMFGMSEAELLGRSAYDIPWSAIDEAGREIPLEERAVEQVLRSGQPLHNAVYGLLPSGRSERIWLLVNAAPQYDDEGELSTVLVSFSDISERRQLEAQLRQSQKMEAVGRLAGGVAHDFNNILTVVIGTSDLILDTAGLDPQLRQDVEQIRASSQRAADLTRQLLAFSRRQVLRPQRTDINIVIIEIKTMLRRLIGEHIELSTRLAPDLAAVCADPSQIEQVIMNLCINSRDAMPRGGRLLIETANVQIDAADAGARDDLEPGSYVRIAVSDTGLGIAHEHQPHIFEPFFTTKGLGQGTGLGLATVHGIASQSGGAVRFHSELGAGTRFEILLPRASAAEAEPSAPSAAHNSLAGNETVLVVEDEQALRELARRALAERGYVVLTAADGDQARALLAEGARPVDLLITDMVMPGQTSGSQLAADARARSPALRVIYMSGYIDAAQPPGDAGRPGAIFLAKPFTPEALARAARAALDA